MSSSDVSQEALNRLVESRARFLSFLRNRISSTEIAEDLLQNAFVKSVEKDGELRHLDSIARWFYRF